MAMRERADDLPSLLLLDAFLNHVERAPQHVLYTWLDAQGREATTLDAATLWAQTGAVADELVRRGVEPGERVMIAYPFGLEFLAGFLGCLRAGVVACSVYPPNPERLKETLPKFNKFVVDAEARYALTTRIFSWMLRGASWVGYDVAQCFEWVPTDKLRPVAKRAAPDFPANRCTLAFIQYSSGSTGEPKGVMITHGALAHNLAVAYNTEGFTPESVGMCWVPQYHDYGLVIGYLLAAYGGTLLYAMSPIDWIRKPLLWAEVLERVRATHTCGPNFAWGLLAKRAGERRFDLSSLISASVAAEPISSVTLAAIEAVGVPRAAISPAYGLAENVVLVCSRGSLKVRDGQVSCGKLAPAARWGKHIIITDDAKAPVADGTVGRIYVRGPDLASGYWKRPELTAERFNVRVGEHDDWHDTGDLGYIADGELYVTGRAKELIIINGRNIYPTDLERLVEAANARLRPGSTVAFQATPSTVGLVLEARPEHANAFEADDLAAWARLCARECSAPVDRVVLLPKGSVPKTTSGKLRRGEAARRALEGEWRGTLYAWSADENEVLVLSNMAAEDHKPSTEAALCAAWVDVLGVERVGPHDDFFELGGTSALAMTLAQRTGCSVEAILAHSTIARLMSAKSSAALVIPRALDRTCTTDAERRWVYLQMRNVHSTANNICFCVDLASNASQFGVLRERLMDAIEATPVLHVRFDGDLALAGTSPPIHQGALDGKTPFDLFTGPVARFGIEGSKIYACVHHAVWDGQSVMNFVRRVRGELVAREDDDLDIRDYAEWEASQSVNVDFWNQVLGPTSKRFDPPSHAGGAVSKVIHVSAAMVEALQRRMQQSRISSFVLATGALHRVLRAYAPPMYWNIGVAVDTRTPQMQTACGMFINNLLIPLSDVDESFAALQKRWLSDFFPRRRDAFTTVRQLGYDCNVFSVVNTEIGDSNVRHLSEDDLNESMDLRLVWEAGISGGWNVRIQSNTGEWPGFGKRLFCVLCSFAENADASVPRLLSGEETTLLEWGTGSSTAVPGLCVHELFEAQAARTPEAVALVFGEAKITYREVERRSRVIALKLRSLGVGPDLLVGLMLPRTLDLVIGHLAILRSGGAFVPIDPKLPSKRIEYILADSGVNHLVTVPALAQEVVCHNVITTQQSDEVAGGTALLKKGVLPEHLAFLMYTSGSTGNPKGVQQRHAMLTNLITAYNHSQDDVVVCATTIMFDPAIREMMVALTMGKRLVVVESPPSIVQGATTRFMIPSVWDVLNKSTSLRSVHFAGEAVHCTALMRACSSKTVFFNDYGPTETHVATSCRFDPTEVNKPSIGRPIANTLCYVVAPSAGKLVPSGVAGELWIGGVGVARGYHDRPALTAAKFAPDPFGGGAVEGRVYKTGDLVRWNTEGELEFIGRVDHQVKVRGFRIELGEVEAALQRLEGVHGAACVVRDGALVGYASPAELDASEIKASLASTLPAYMVPSVVVGLAALPLTANGKVDRKALPDPELQNAEYVAPRMPAEAALCAVFEEVLGIERVGVHDDFFALGGHSLLAMRAARKTGYSVAQLLAHPSAAALAELERDADCLKHHPESTRATDAERRLVYLQLAEPASVAYHVPFEWTFDAGVDVLANLRLAIETTPVLSVRFMAEGGAVDGPSPLVVEGRVDATTPFDLQTGPVARFGVEGQTLTACVHHAVFDGRSIGLFLRRVADPVGAPRDALTVRDYAEHEAARPADVGFWRGAMPEAPRFVPPVVKGVAWRSGLRVPASVASRARAVCALRGVSSFVFVLGAVHRVLRAYASQASWAIGVAFDARPPELQHTCGMFVNTVLVPFEAAEVESLEALRDRWVGKLLPRARDTYHEVVSAVGGECNVMLACNLGMGFGDAPSVDHKAAAEEEEPSTMSKFDLSLSFMDDADGGWLVGVESGVGEWPRLTERVEHVVGALIEASDDHVTATGLLLPGEETTLLEWGTGPSTAVPDLCVHELFEAQALRTPEAVALVFGEAEITYGELQKRAASLASHLQEEHGVGPDVLVGLLMDRGFELVVGMLGILLAGGAYVPTDPSYPEERVRFVVEDGGLSLLVTQREYRRSKMDVCLDVFEFPVHHATLCREVGPSHLAYMIYTSGSTGRPKGVEIRHGNLVNYVAWTMMSYNAGSSALCTSICFDLSLTSLWTPLSSGANLYIPKNKDIWDAFDEMTDMAFDLLKLPTGIVASVPCLASTIVVGGEALHSSMLDQLPGSTIVVDEYGPTETTVGCVTRKISVKDTKSAIGRPIVNTRCYVVSSPNNANALSPAGVVGELWIGGIGVARGYHDRPALTAAKFLPDPFGGKGRVYKTGDLVRWNGEGELEFIGRVDHQVKVRGFRVELGEVEAALQRLEGVRGAACVVRDGSLVGYVVSAAELDASEIKASLASSLPAYVVPSVVVVLAALPLTANGKVDRKALPEPEFKQAEYEAPRTPKEAGLCAVFEQVLGVARVGVHDDFFALGGHSLLAMRAARETGYSVAQLLAHPSAAALAELERDVDRLQHHPESTRATDAERRLAYLQLAEPASVAYHVPFEWTFDAGVDVRANLQRAIEATQVLSVRFTAEGEAVDGLPPSVVEGGADVMTPFDLQTGPVARFWVEGQTLTACVHHAVFDGRSVVLFLRRVADPAGAPRDAFTVRDYAEHEAARPADVGFWRGAVPEAPRFAPPMSAECAAVWRSGLRVPASFVSRARAACASRGVSSFVFVLGAVHRVLHAYASQASWAIGVAFDARPPELQHTCGMFVNTVLVPFEAAEVESLEALRDRWVGELLPRARDPYHEVVSAVGGECNVMLACNLGMGFGEAPSVEHDEVEGPVTSKFDLSLSFVDDADGAWLVGVESGVGEWPRLTDRLAHVVGAMAEASDGDAAATGLLLPGEETTLLEWGTGPNTAVSALCVHELFEAQAARTPEALALVFGEAEMTYGELKKKAAALASHLQESIVVGVDVLVGLLMERGFDLVVGMLGILLAGGAYVPIDPLYPEERVQFVVQDGGVALLVTQSVHRRSASDVCLDASEFVVRQHAALRREVRPSHLAYMIYTSGSTGRPKGVKVCHHGVVNVVQAVRDLVLPSDHVWFPNNICFDQSVRVWAQCLSAGARLVIVDDPTHCPTGITYMHVVPSLVPEIPNSSTRTVVTGGENFVHKPQWSNFATAWMNSYGPTETTITVTQTWVRYQVKPNIGRPIANTLCYVVTPNTITLAPPGVAGELWIGGVGVARGYHDRPALTSAKFVPDPFGGGGHVEGRVYKTGDLVRWNLEGELEFIGRVDHQVKVRGFRVELGEVEAALQRLECVCGAACVVRDGSLVGYVVSAAELDASEIKASLASSLPAYMVPSLVVALEALPLTANGKVDRKALPDPEFKQVEYAAPRTPNEAALCAAWAAALGVVRVGVHDDFFALGGHSLLAVKLVNNLRKWLCPRVSVRDLLECTTPAQLVVRVHAMETGETAAVVEKQDIEISLRRSRGTLRPY